MPSTCILTPGQWGLSPLVKVHFVYFSCLHHELWTPHSTTAVHESQHKSLKLGVSNCDHRVYKRSYRCSLFAVNLGKVLFTFVLLSNFTLMSKLISRNILIWYDTKYWKEFSFRMRGVVYADAYSEWHLCTSTTWRTQSRSIKHRRWQKSHRCKRGRKWNVWSTASRRAVEEYLETYEVNGIRLQHRQKYCFFFSSSWYFQDLRQHCASLNSLFWIRAPASLSPWVHDKRW